MLQILLVLYFVEVLQKAYLAKKQDLCQTATAVSLTCIVVVVLILTVLTSKNMIAKVANNYFIFSKIFGRGAKKKHLSCCQLAKLELLCA